MCWKYLYLTFAVHGAEHGCQRAAVHGDFGSFPIFAVLST